MSSFIYVCVSIDAGRLGVSTLCSALVRDCNTAALYEQHYTFSYAVSASKFILP